MKQAGDRLADILRGSETEKRSGTADFRADTKWWNYRNYYDRFRFAVSDEFPLDMIAGGCGGVIVADRFGAEIRREAPLQPMAQGLRRKWAIRFGRVAAHRRLRFLHEEPR